MPCGNRVQVGKIAQAGEMWVSASLLACLLSLFVPGDSNAEEFLGVLVLKAF